MAKRGDKDYLFDPLRCPEFCATASVKFLEEPMPGTMPHETTWLIRPGMTLKRPSSFSRGWFQLEEKVVTVAKLQAPS
uniref:Uncharacterized protein n=1 Tax=Agrobacterium fabrum TaxID=1176649 RepID=A0A2Z2PGP7_9HYPH|nr:hypothetical protein [Agrobacterium fabrum]